MNFTAIDFETATSVYSSICSMGICVVEDNKVIERRDILIRPQPFEFNEYNTKIHGIEPYMVEDKGMFCDYWAEIKPYLEQNTIIAHNAQFDVGALRAVLDMFGIEYPTFDYLCTVKLSQKAYPDLKSHKLNNLGEALGIEFEHHQAGEDAYACACVMLKILEDYNLDTIQDIVDKFEIGVGKIYPGFHEPCRKNKKKSKKINCNNSKTLDLKPKKG